MTILDRIFPTSRTGPRLDERAEVNRIFRAGVEKGKLESRSMFTGDLQGLFGSARSNAGEMVTEERALTISAVYAAVTVLSGTIAYLPLKLYRKNNDQRTEASDHPLYRVLHFEANPRMSAFQYRQAMMLHLLLWGNSYSDIETDNGGDVTALWPINPRRVEIRRVGNKSEYKIWLPDGGRLIRNQEQILHVSNMGVDGVEGKSPITLFKESLGITLAAEKYGAKFFKNDARPGMYLKHPAKLSDTAHSHLKRDLAERQGGADNAWKPQILEEGMDIGTVGLPPGDAQFLETRKFGVTDVARIFNIPPHKLADLDRATFSNIENLALEFVTQSLNPRLKNIEQQINRRLLTGQEQGTFYAEHDTNALLRGDVESRGKFYATMWEHGVMSPNDIRKKENDNPIPDGDTYYVPMNYIPVGSDPDEMFRSNGKRETREARAALPPRYKLARAMLPMLRDTFSRANRKEIADLREATDKYLLAGNTEGFRTFLEQFETNHSKWLMERGRIQPLFQTFHEQMAQAARDEIGGDIEIDEQFTRDYAEAYTKRHSGATRGQLQALLDEDNPREAVQLRLDEWEGEDHTPRHEKEADNERVRGSNAFTKVAWASLGVATIRWRTVGSNCPMCDSLDGRAVEITHFFVSEGDSIPNPDGVDIVTRTNIGHPPIHAGCDCIVTPALGRKRLTAFEMRKVKDSCLDVPMYSRRNGVHAH